jgi:hypothetical protein
MDRCDNFLISEQEGARQLPAPLLPGALVVHLSTSLYQILAVDLPLQLKRK